jgi:MoxR-like ATPase
LRVTQPEGARILAHLERVILGKRDELALVLAAVLAGGHVLLEDVPGVGKTTLARAIARTFHLEFKRVQFTPDLMPTDIVGSMVLRPQDGTFEFHPGPVFTHILLADEVNRASPRTQSALLEAMSEGQVTTEGVTRVLAEPFFVIATQNPLDYEGTYPLPEAQLDRFLMRLRLGYPSAEQEL